MVGRRTPRGAVISALNRLVEEGVIVSFKTSFFDREGVPQVSATAPTADAVEQARERVCAAVASVPDVVVIVQPEHEA